MIEEITLVGQVGGVTVELKPVKEVARTHGYSASYIQNLCWQGKLIAIKYSRVWFVEKNLSQIETLTPLLDSS